MPNVKLIFAFRICFETLLSQYQPLDIFVTLLSNEKFCTQKLHVTLHCLQSNPNFNWCRVLHSIRVFLMGCPNYKDGYLLIGKKHSLKFLKCDQLTKVREQQYLYRVCRKSPWEKDFSLGKTSLVTANSLRLGRTAGPGLLAGRIF